MFFFKATHAQKYSRAAIIYLKKHRALIQENLLSTNADSSFFSPGQISLLLAALSAVSK